MTGPESSPTEHRATPADGDVARPTTAGGGAARPAMLLVGPPGRPDGAHHDSDAAPPLADVLGDALVAAGVAVATLGASAWRDDDAAGPVDAAVRLLAWMQRDPAIDPERIGVLGLGEGAIVVACAAGVRAGVNRVVLVSPNAPDGVRPRGAEDAPDEGRIPALLAGVGVSSAAAPLSHHPFPVLVVSGAADRIAPPETADAWIAAFEQTERPAVHEQIGRAGHAFAEAEHRAALVARVTSFAKDMAAAAPAVGAA